MADIGAIAGEYQGVGYGSWLDEALHYHLEMGGKFVEVG